MRCVCPWQRPLKWAAHNSYRDTAFFSPLKYLHESVIQFKLCGRWSSWDTEDRRKDFNEVHLCISQSLSQIWTYRKREATLSAELGRKVPSATGELVSDERVGWLTLGTGGAIRKPPKTDLSRPRLSITRVTWSGTCWEGEQCNLVQWQHPEEAKSQQHLQMGQTQLRGNQGQAPQPYTFGYNIYWRSKINRQYISN